MCPTSVVDAMQTSILETIVSNVRIVAVSYGDVQFYLIAEFLNLIHFEIVFFCVSLT